MTPRERVEEALRARGSKRAGNNWTCPAHDDDSPSLSVGEGEDGKVLLNCFGGCSVDAIAGALDLSKTDLFPEPSASKTIVAEYDYRDEEGVLLYQVVRFEPKDFRQRRPDSAQGWVWSLKGVRRVLYRLPEVLDAISLGETIYVCEGEKDVEALEKAGVVATTNAGGAGKWDESFTKILANASNIVLVADNDKPGIEHMRHIAGQLNGTPNRIVTAAVGKDAADHLALAPLASLITVARDDSENRDDGKLEIAIVKPSIIARVARSFDSEQVKWLAGYEGLIPLGMVTMLAGLPGLGKSMLMCLIAANESQHGRTVCIAAAEDSIEHVLIPRLVAAGADLDLIHFLAYTDSRGEGPILLPDHGNLLHDAVVALKPSILFVDPIGSFMGRAVDSWKATDVRAALGPFKSIAEAAGCAVLLVAHLNKGTGAYLDRVSDSAAFGQLVRSGLLFGRNPTDPDGEAGEQRTLVSGKLNVGLRPAARNYKMVAASVPDSKGIGSISTARLEYTGESATQTDDLLARRAMAELPGDEVAEAMIVLGDFLRDGPHLASDCKAEAKKHDVARAKLYEAKTRLHVETVKKTFGGAVEWKLP